MPPPASSRTTAGALEPWQRDLRQAWRALCRSPGFAATAIATLALCLGANAAIFSMLYTLALRPLPFPEPDRLLEVGNNYSKSGLLGAPCSVQQYLDYREQADAFVDMGLYYQFGTVIHQEHSYQRVNIARVTYGFFAALGVQPLLGDFFAPEDSAWGNDQKFVLTESFWRSHFGADPDIVGKPVRTGGSVYTVVGVAPRSVELIDPTVKVIKPTVWRDGWITEMNRHAQGYALLGRLFCRLKPGATIEQARAQMETLDRRFYESASTEYRHFIDAAGYTLSIQPMRDGLLGAAKTRLYVLQGAALMVLIIGCINLMHLLLVRAQAREAEVAMRAALGAGRGAIARRWLMEPLLLTASGGALAVGMAWAGIKLINRFALSFLPRTEPFSLDVPVLLFALALGVAAALGISLLPLRQIRRTDLIGVLRRGSANATGGPRSRLVGAVLVPAQIALSLVLTMSAALLARSFANAANHDVGFEADGVATVRTVLAGAQREGREVVRQLQTRILESLRSIPGVEAVGMASVTPMHEQYPLRPIHVHGATTAAGGAQPVIRLVPILGDYFPALKIPVLAGRAFHERDDAWEARTVIIDERVARLYFPGEDPVGRRIALNQNPSDENDWLTIVGVVGFASVRAVDEIGGVPFCYLPEPRFQMAGNSYFVRSTRAPREILADVRERIKAINPTLEQYHAGALADFVSDSLDHRRALVLFVGLFAGLALFLAVLGIYGVLSFEVAQRTREIGIRTAIGASGRAVLGMILRQGVWKISAGIALGAVGSFLAGRILAASLFGIAPHDPATFIVVAGALFAAGVAASVLPALRASRIDPILALRTD